MFALKNKRNGISLCRLGYTLGGGTCGCLGSIFFSVAYQIKWDGEHNGIQVKCAPYGQTCYLEV